MLPTQNHKIIKFPVRRHAPKPVVVALIRVRRPRKGAHQEALDHERSSAQNPYPEVFLWPDPSPMTKINILLIESISPLYVDWNFPLTLTLHNGGLQYLKITSST